MSAMLGTSSFAGTGIAMRPAAVQRTNFGTFIPIRAAQYLQGKVVSSSSKTAVVAVDNWGTHPVYKKRVKQTTKYLAHDEEEKCQKGDVVVLAPSKPLSRKKRFTIDAILQTAN